MKKQKSKRSDVNRSGVTRTSPNYLTLTEQEKAEHGRAVGLLYDLRHGRDSYTKLLRKHRLTTRKARRYLGPNLLGGTRGKRVRASQKDNLVRKLMFPWPSGDAPELIRGSAAATKLSNYFQDRGELLGGDMSSDEFESKWLGVHIDGREVFANAEAILKMGDADTFGPDGLYSSVGPEK